MKVLIIFVLVSTIYADDLEGILQDPSLPPLESCGEQIPDDRIIGGKITGLREFPWMAALMYRYKNCGRCVGLRCAGTVITKRHILTAAHCMSHPSYNMVRAFLGDWRLSTDPDCVEFMANDDCNPKIMRYDIIKQVVHPEYDKPATLNDIGVAIVDRDMEFTENIRPICLPKLNVVHAQVGDPLEVAGWGVVEEGSADLSDYKRKVNVPLVSNSVCLQKLSKPISDKNLCAGGKGGKDSCGGDSGGPLMNHITRETLEKKFFLEGIVSWGDECGIEGNPAAYTKVSSFIDWILKVVKTEKLEPDKDNPALKCSDICYKMY